MSEGDPETLESIISPFCEGLSIENIVKQCSKVLLQVKLPDTYHQTTYLKLDKSCPTFEYRKKLLKKFTQLHYDRLTNTGEGFLLDKNEEIKIFCNELGAFIDKESCSVPKHDFEVERKKQPSSDIVKNDLLDNIQFNGVVVRRSDSQVGYVSVISCSSGREVFMKLDQNNCPGHNIAVKIGDVFSVIQTGKEFDYGIACCFHLDEREIFRFLDDILDMTKDETDVRSAQIELARCDAVWNYILQIPHQEEHQEVQQEVQQKVIPKILEVCKNVCSTGRHTSEILKGIWMSFARSKFLENNLPKFIRNTDAMRKYGNYKLVQNFLTNFLQVCPEFTVKMNPIMQQLTITGKQIGSDDIAEFLCQLLVNVGANVPGAEDLTWKHQPSIPLARELSDECQISTAHLPKIKVTDKYASVEEYLKTYFTLMREECFHKLKIGIRKFLDTGEFDPKDIMMYRVMLCGVDADFSKSSLPGLPFILKCSEEKTDKSEIDWESTSWLMYGDLLCISLDGTFKKPIWGLVSRCDKELNKKGLIYVTLCSERNCMSDAEVVSELQKLTDEGLSAYMAESNTFYRAFGPALDILQHKDTVSFKEYLVNVSQTEKVPNYIGARRRPPDWSAIFNISDNEGCAGCHSTDAKYSVVEDFQRMKEECDSKLDETQLDAIHRALTNEVALIQGPPGTGKSYVGVALVKLLLSMDLPGPILVATYKNFALDHFLQSCLEQIPECGEPLGLVRVGKSELIPEEHRLYKTARYVEMSHDNYKYKERLTTELNGMDREICKTFRKLREANKFNTMMFIKEAEDTHIITLMKNDTKNDKKKLEKLTKHRDPNNETELIKMTNDAFEEWLPSEEEIKYCFGVCKAEQEFKIRTHESGVEGTEESDLNTMILEPSHENKERLYAEDMPAPMEYEETNSQEPALLARDNPPRCSKGQRTLPPVPCERLGPHFKSVLNTGDIWELSPVEKVHLMYALRQKYYNRVSKTFMELVELYSRKKCERQEILDQHKIGILKKAKVIGMTVTGAAIRADWLASIRPCVMIVEEAAEILESQLVAVIPSSVQHLIMIGDHEQLKPQIHYDKLRRNHNMDMSMFERLIKGGIGYTQLKYQGRMRDEFADLLRKLKIYKDLKTRYTLVEKNDPLPCVSKALFFIKHNQPESASRNSHSYMNEYEAKEVVKTAKELMKRGAKAAKITILCSYRGQVLEIQSTLNSKGSEERIDIEVTTIDSFQGRENDIILLSLVRSPGPKIGYLCSKNRICVAISRARRGLYIFGNANLLKNRSSYWKTVINEMSVGKAFPWSNSEGDVIADGPHSPPPPSSTPVHVQQVFNQYHLNINSPTGNLAIGDNARIDVYTGTGINQTNPTPTSPTHDPAKHDQVRSTQPQGTQAVVQTLSAEGVSPVQEENKYIIVGESGEVKSAPHQETQTQLKEPIQRQETGGVKGASYQETQTPLKEPIQRQETGEVKGASHQETQTQLKEPIQRLETAGGVKGASHQETQTPLKEPIERQESAERRTVQESGEVQKISRQETKPSLVIQSVEEEGPAKGSHQENNSEQPPL